MESALYGIYALVVFVSEILLVGCAHSFDFWYVNNSCVNTVRQHFPWSILYVLCLIYYVMIFYAVISIIYYYNIMGDKLLLNFGAKFQRLYYCIRNFCNLIGLEQWYFRLIWNTYMWKLQTFRG